MKYPGDFRLVNAQFLAELASQKKPIILETPLSDLARNHADSTAYWEADTLMEKPYLYIHKKGIGPGGQDVLLPSKK